VARDGVISEGLWPAHYLDLTPCDFYLWGSLNEKAYKWNPHTSHELEENIPEQIFRMPPSELPRVNQSVISQSNACLRAQGEHFQRLLWTGTFVSKFLFSCTAVAMARFAEREPVLPGARKCAMRSKCKITKKEQPGTEQYESQLQSSVQSNDMAVMWSVQSVNSHSTFCLFFVVHFNVSVYKRSRNL
jgi:hypothetical protein